MSEKWVTTSDEDLRGLNNRTFDHQLEAARLGDHEKFSELVEPYRQELISHCYRMIGSIQDSEDMVQETYLRAWRKLNSFQGRASLRAWLYKIATNVCLDVLKQHPRRMLPQMVRKASDFSFESIEPPVSDPVWLEPFPDEMMGSFEENPEAHYEVHESISLAFLTALQMLSPRQRCCLIFCEVLDWPIIEVADLLNTTISAVNSMLYRARVRLNQHYDRTRTDERSIRDNNDVTSLLERYVSAWESADLDALMSLLTEDVSFPMPPLPVWYQGHSAIRQLLENVILEGDSRGRWRLVPVHANGQPSYAWYRLDDSAYVYRSYAIQVLTLSGALISVVTTFGFPNLFSRFNLPDELPVGS